LSSSLIWRDRHHIDVKQDPSDQPKIS
jgi:hypothetical protein